MDIFGDDSMLGGEGDDLNENIRQGDVGDDDENNEDEDGNKKDSEAEPVPVEHKKRSVRNPQVRFYFIQLDWQFWFESIPQDQILFNE